MKDTANKLRELIKIQKISNYDYIFFPGKFKNNEHKRSKFLSSYIKKSMINSKAFPDNGVKIYLPIVLEQHWQLINTEKKGYLKPKKL